MPDTLLANVSDDVRQRAARIRLACFDVDGVLTDGRLSFDAGGRESKSFHSQDGLGLKLLADFAFEDPRGRLWKVPAGVEVDGASIPRIFWTLFGGPFEGNYIHASVVHDHFCVTRTRSSEPAR